MITRDTDYAIRALSCILGSGKNLVTVSGLSELLDIPKPFLRKILQILNKKGLLKSSKGKGGGFSLMAKAEDINILELVEIFQGPFQLSEHIFKGKKCPNIQTCDLKKRLDKISDHVSRELKAITIKDLIS